jgi:hypothetical protein
MFLLYFLFVSLLENIGTIQWASTLLLTIKYFISLLHSFMALTFVIRQSFPKILPLALPTLDP